MAVADSPTGRRIRPGFLIAWVGVVLVVVALALLRLAPRNTGPTLTLVSEDGTVQTISLDELKRLPMLSRLGEYQNQYENWRDRGVYTGVRLVDLLGAESGYQSIRVVASDGYAVVIERWRVEDPVFSMILAYGFDGLEVPAWKDGFRLAVLPESGRVGNEAYGLSSAGSYWVKNVDRIELQ